MDICKAFVCFTMRDENTFAPDDGESWFSVATKMTAAVLISGELEQCETDDDLDQALITTQQKIAKGELSDDDYTEAIHHVDYVIQRAGENEHLFAGLCMN